ncbi:MAG: barstar family protein [Myxococcales bacterium]|nr:barstar family protein [Myxococcales bacterium]
MTDRAVEDFDTLAATWANLPPGFHRHALDRARAISSPLALAAACNTHALRLAVLDLRPITDKTSLLHALTRALSLPPSARTGFDAATDAIAAYLATPPATTAILLWQSPSLLRRRDPATWRTALDVFTEAAARAASHGPALVLVT